MMFKHPLREPKTIDALIDSLKVKGRSYKYYCDSHKDKPLKLFDKVWGVIFAPLIQADLNVFEKRIDRLYREVHKNGSGGKPSAIKDSRTLYLGDLFKVFKKTFKDMKYAAASESMSSFLAILNNLEAQ